MRKTTKNPGRPRLGKVKAKISLTPVARSIAARTACSMGLDMSVYIEGLIRTANEAEFLAEIKHREAA